jgi:integrase
MHLRWEQIDFDKQVAHVPKTKNGDPMMLPLLSVTLRSLKKRREADGAVKLSGLVFPSRVSDKQPVQIESAWRTAKARAGITDLRFHDLRHTAASYLAMNGASLPEIGNVLGHRSAQSTNRYAHMVQGHTHGLVRDTMAKLLGEG